MPEDRAPLTILMNSAHGGGAEHVGRTWAAQLAATGYAPRLMVINPIDERSRIHVDDAALASIQQLGRGGRWTRYRELRQLLSIDSSSAVVSLQMRPNLLTLLVAASVPRRRRAVVAISERNIVSIYAGEVSRSHRMRVWLARRLYRYADVMLAISHPVAAEMIAGFGVKSERCKVVPNPAGVKRSDAKREARPSGCDIELVLTGRLVAQKQPLVAIGVARELVARGLSIRLVAFGEGPLLDDLVTAAEASRVELDVRGWVEDWTTHCSDAAVLLLPSCKEGFGNVLVEAAAARIPSVTLSGALGVADALVPGITGVLALDARPEVLADAVMAARACSFAGVEDWLRRFSPENSTATLVQALFSSEEQ